LITYFGSVLLNGFKGIEKDTDVKPDKVFFLDKYFKSYLPTGWKTYLDAFTKFKRFSFDNYNGQPKKISAINKLVLKGRDDAFLLVWDKASQGFLKAYSEQERQAYKIWLRRFIDVPTDATDIVKTIRDAYLHGWAEVPIPKRTIDYQDTSIITRNDILRFTERHGDALMFTMLFYARSRAENDIGQRNTCLRDDSSYFLDLLLAWNGDSKVQSEGLIDQKQNQFDEIVELFSKALDEETNIISEGQKLSVTYYHRQPKGISKTKYLGRIKDGGYLRFKSNPIILSDRVDDKLRRVIMEALFWTNDSGRFFKSLFRIVKSSRC
jgi:hypothetical protein